MDLDIRQVPGAGKKPVTWQLWAGNSTLLIKSERLAEIGLLFRYFLGAGTNEERLEAEKLLKAFAE